MQRTRSKRPILRPKSSRSKPEAERERKHVTTEEDFSLQEERNFATEPDIRAGDQFKTKPAEPAMEAERQASMEGEEGIRQAGEQWPEGNPENRFGKQARQHKRERQHKTNPYRSHR